jgi:ribonuclease P protein component
VPSEAFGKSLRLLNARDYGAVFDDAPVRASHQHLLILSKPNQLSSARLGLVIAKKNVRLAVQRNRIKRILRESFRLNQQQLVGLDIVILARRGLDELDNRQLHKLINKQWQRLLKRKAQLDSKSGE